ncbi:hypothetical protein PG997_007454 [Apiospora hydei]|uniref:Uncharacterized protein n=1 Tax=Apiospora hydei TaxID=1337664 RepID=A0ABR1W819_9PEZI
MPQSQWSLVNYWGPQWRSPAPEKSKECLALSVITATLLALAHHLAQRFYLPHPPAATAAAGTGGLLVLTIYLVVPLKLLDLFAQDRLLWEHMTLHYSKYADPFAKHEPLYAGLIAACAVLAARALVPGCGLGLDLLLYSLEAWFWAGYWFNGNCM